MISVVIPSYLGQYKNAARDREKKIIRAIDSVLNQTIRAEAVVISDGCSRTINILNKRYDNQISGYRINKSKLWSGTPRNTGLDKANNEIVCYLDIDDYLEPDHCERIIKMFTGDWVWFNDKIYSKGRFISRRCDVNKRGLCGTSNIAHKRDLVRWPVNGSYAHDWVLIRALKKASRNYKYIGDGGYRVCHVPGKFDV